MSSTAQPQRFFFSVDVEYYIPVWLPSPFGDVLSDILAHRSKQYIHRSFLRCMSSIVTYQVDVQHCYMPGGCPTLLDARWMSSIGTCQFVLPFPFCDMFEWPSGPPLKGQLYGLDWVQEARRLMCATRDSWEADNDIVFFFCSTPRVCSVKSTGLRLLP